MYSVNRSHSLIGNALDPEHDRDTAVRALLELVERTLPIAQIVYDYSTDLEAQVDPDSRDVGSDLIESARATFLTLVASGTDPMVAKQGNPRT